MRSYLFLGSLAGRTIRWVASKTRIRLGAEIIKKTEKTELCYLRFLMFIPQ